MMTHEGRGKGRPLFFLVAVIMLFATVQGALAVFDGYHYAMSNNVYDSDGRMNLTNSGVSFNYLHFPTMNYSGNGENYSGNFSSSDNDYMQTPNWSVGNGYEKSLSVSMWVKFISFTNEVLFSTSGTGAQLSSLLWLNTSGNLHFNTSNATNGSATYWDCSAQGYVESPGIWYHVAAVRNESGCYLFVNGVLNASQERDYSLVNIGTGDPNMTFGRWPSGYGTSNDFNGYFDEIWMTNQSLTPAQIVDLYNCNNPDSCGAAQISYSSELIWASLVNYTNSTSVFEDMVGSYDVTNNGVTVNTTGKYVDCRVASPNMTFSSALNVGYPFTIAFWMKADDLNTDAFILTKRESVTKRFTLFDSGGSGFLRSVIGYDASSTNYWDVTNSYVQTANNWVPVFIMSDGFRLILAVNGTSVYDGSGALFIPSINNTGEWTFCEYSGVGGNNWTGKVTQAYFFNKVLAPGEIALHTANTYAGGTFDFDPFASEPLPPANSSWDNPDMKFTFDDADTNSTHTFDSIGSADGTLSITTGYNASTGHVGKVGQAYHMNATSDDFAVQPTYDFSDDYGSFSMAAWVKMDNMTDASSRHFFLGNTNGWLVLNPDGEMEVGLTSYNSTNDGDWVIGYYMNNTGLSVEEWQHIVVTWEGGTTSDGLHVYIDGQLVTPEDYYDDAQFPGFNKTVFDVYPPGIGGGAQNPVAVGNALGGYMDEVLFYDAALNAANVTALYDSYEVPSCTLEAPCELNITACGDYSGNDNTVLRLQNDLDISVENLTYQAEWDTNACLYVHNPRGNVTLDCNGYAIYGNVTSPAAIFFDNASENNITVKNCNIDVAGGENDQVFGILIGTNDGVGCVGEYIVQNNSVNITGTGGWNEAVWLYGSSSPASCELVGKSVIRDNFVRRFGDDAGAAILLDVLGCNDVQIYNNEFSSLSSSNTDQLLYFGAGEFVLYNNVVAGAASGARLVYQASGSSNLYGYNNTFNTSGTYLVWSSGAALLNDSVIGNLWLRPNGTGFSQTCADANVDGICDTTYDVDSTGYVDYLPIALIVPVPPNVTYVSLVSPANGSNITQDQEFKFSFNSTNENSLACTAYTYIQGQSTVYDDFEGNSSSLWSVGNDAFVSTNYSVSPTHSFQVALSDNPRSNAFISSTGKTVVSFWVYGDTVRAQDSIQPEFDADSNTSCLMLNARWPSPYGWGYLPSGGSWTTTGVNSSSGRGMVNSSWVNIKVLVDNDNKKFSLRIGDTSVDDLTNVTFNATCGGAIEKIRLIAGVETMAYFDDIEYWNYDEGGWDGNGSVLTAFASNASVQNNTETTFVNSTFIGSLTGVYPWYVQCGNNVSDTWYFDVISPPNATYVSLVSPANGSNVTSSSQQFTFKFNSTNSSTLSCDLYSYDGLETVYDDAEGNISLKWSGTGTASTEQAVSPTHSIKTATSGQTMTSTSFIPSTGNVLLSFYVRHSGLATDNLQPQIKNAAGDQTCLYLNGGYTGASEYYWGYSVASWVNTTVPSNTGRGMVNDSWVQIRLMFNQTSKKFSLRIGNTASNDVTDVSMSGCTPAYIVLNPTTTDTVYWDDFEYWNYDECGWDGCTFTNFASNASVLNNTETSLSNSTYLSSIVGDYWWYAQCGANVSSAYTMYVDTCTPSWSCSGYASCLINDTQYCNAVTDLNTCGENYTGDYSEFSPQACDYCTPSWFCGGYGVCTEIYPLLNGTQECNAANDTNDCYAQTGLPSDQYAGNYSEFLNQSCVYRSAYVAAPNVTAPTYNLSVRGLWTLVTLGSKDTYEWFSVKVNGSEVVTNQTSLSYNITVPTGDVNVSVASADISGEGAVTWVDIPIMVSNLGVVSSVTSDASIYWMRNATPYVVMNVTSLDGYDGLTATVVVLNNSVQYAVLPMSRIGVTNSYEANISGVVNASIENAAFYGSITDGLFVENGTSSAKVLDMVSQPVLDLPAGVQQSNFTFVWLLSQDNLGNLSYTLEYDNTTSWVSAVSRLSNLTYNSTHGIATLNPLTAPVIEGIVSFRMRALDSYVVTNYTTDTVQISLTPGVSGQVCAALTYPNPEDLPAQVVIPVNFSVFAPLGFSSPSAVVNLTYGATKVTSSACSYTTVDSTHRNYACNVSMHYYYDPGDYDLLVVYTDGSRSANASSSGACTYGQLIAAKNVVKTLSFPTAAPGVSNAPASESVNVENIGNAPLDVGIRSYDLIGRSNSAVKLLASTFKAGASLGSSYVLQDSMDVNTSIVVDNGFNESEAVGFWLSMPSNQMVQDYYTPTPWAIITTG